MVLLSRLPLRSLTALALVFAAYSACAAEGTVRVPGGLLAYESCNSAPASQTVILIHDFTLDSGVWNGVFPLLCENFRVVRFDQRGYGKSPPSTAAYSSIEDIGLLMKGLGLERATLVGASANGGRAVAFTLDHPDAVESLILVGPVIPGVPFSTDFTALQIPFAQAIQNGDESAAHALAERLGHVVKRDNAAALAEMRRLIALRKFIGATNLETPVKPILDRLPGVHKRTLVISGESDHPNNLEHAKIAHEKIPGASYVLMKNAAHLVYLEHPAEFAALVVDFLRENRRP
jgi:3-oxoadipate enol-lactonase